MSKAGKRVKSGGGQGGPAKWEAGLLAAVFEEVNLYLKPKGRFFISVYNVKLTYKFKGLKYIRRDTYSHCHLCIHCSSIILSDNET